MIRLTQYEIKDIRVLVHRYALEPTYHKNTATADLVERIMEIGDKARARDLREAK